MSWESDSNIQSSDTPVKRKPWRNAPLGIKLVSLFYVLNMLFLLATVGAITGLDHPLAGVLFLVMVVLSVVGLFCAIGLLTLRPWGYLGIFVITVLLGLINLVALNLVSVIVCVVLIHVLLKHGHHYVDDEATSG